MKEYAGKTLEEILDEISKKYNVSVDDITYEVLEEKGGFLGIGSKVVVKAYTKQDILEFIENYLNQYFTSIQMTVDVKVEENDNFYKVILNAENNAIIIGKNGQTLQSINAVLKAAVSSEFKRKISVLIDVNGYKDEKYKKICSMAVRIAKTVQKTKTDALLDPMPNDERKAIHNYLTNMQYIRTVSEGEGNQRRIKIVYDESK